MQHYSTRDFEPSLSVGFLVKRCASLLSTVGEAAFESQPLSVAGFMVLMRLRKKSAMSPSELSTKTGYDMGGLTRVVDALEQAGLVKRERRLDDRRSVRIAITSPGIRQAEKSLATIVDLLNQILEPFSKREVEALVSSLQHLGERLKEFVETQPRAQPRLTPSKPGRVLTQRTR
jgi:DNA-binding MarR family transcriptional regulator